MATQKVDQRQKGRAFTLHHYAKTCFKKEKTFNKKFPLEKYFDPMIGDKSVVHIADVGAGMWSTTGSYHKTAEVHVYPSDELAEGYATIQKEAGIKALFKIEYQDMERLTYADNTFDIVHCVNALDHAENPYKAIREMYRVCSIGGWVYLRNYTNTANLQKFRGMHQWNFVITENGDVKCSSKEKTFLLSECVPGFTNVNKKEGNDERHQMIVSTIQKK